MRTEGKIVYWDGKKLVIIPAAEDAERISEDKYNRHSGTC